MTEQAEHDPAIDENLARIREALDGMQFGTVVLTVHNGRVVQIDVTEKTRFKD